MGPPSAVLVGLSTSQRLTDLLSAFKINLSPTDLVSIQETVGRSNEDVGQLERDTESSLFAAIHSN